MRGVNISMKRFFCFVSALLFLVSVSVLVSAVAFAGQNQVTGEYSYYSDGKIITLPLSPQGVIVKFRKGVSHSQIRSLLEAEPEMGPFVDRKELSSPEHLLLKVKEGVTPDAITGLLDRFIMKPDVEFVSPLFDYQGTEMALGDEFIVQFKPEATDYEVANLNLEHGVEVVKRDFLGEKTFILRLPGGTGRTLMNIANTYHENPIVEYAHPNFMRLIKPLATPNDTYFNNQWNLNNTGQNGWTVDADIDAPEAWDINTGSSTVTVAIIDEGVDLTHEDLTANLVGGYDATGLGSGGGPNSWDGHGTSCAGIVSGAGNNSTGVAGVNWDVKIMPVRIAYSPSTCKGCYWITYDSWIANGIQWAVNNGAAVLSNSWGGGSPSTVITNAIIYAKTSGRGGLGSVVAFASGNSNGAVIYPATRSEVIAVGATSPCDERKSPSSCDGEYWWGSNYGAELDVAAPGVKIYTTDIMGNGGYTTGNYITDFNGTSSATPHVAGLAGLILSANSSLTASEVETIIYNTADDRGTAGWDQYFGYGRINAYTALLAVPPPTINISGSISYGGSRIGNIRVLAYTNSRFLGTPAYSTSITNPGNYTISNVTSGTYYLLSYRDSNGDGIKQPNEAYGIYGSPGSPTPVVVSGSSITGVNITLYDPGSVSGTITYTGSVTGLIYIQAFTNVNFSGPAVYSARINAPGSYQVRGMLPGTYYVRSYRDYNNNNRIDTGEPSGKYGAPTGVIVNTGSVTSGINITLN